MVKKGKKGRADLDLRLREERPVPLGGAGDLVYVVHGTRGLVGHGHPVWMYLESSVDGHVHLAQLPLASQVLGSSTPTRRSCPRGGRGT